MKKILFMGDSITDAGRYGDPEALGYGYARLITAKLGAEHPGELTFQNLGSSGDRVVSIYARVGADIIAQKPDIMTFLIGVNDVWHEFDYQNGASPEKFEMLYTMLIEETLEALPDLKIITMEPFVMLGGATEGEPRYADFRREVAKRAEVVRRLSEKYGFPCIPLQEMFDKLAVQTGDPTYWLSDGVHPTAFGHAAIANVLLPEIEKLL